MTFYIGVYKDQRYAENLIQALRNIYPELRIISISDGVKDTEYEMFCNKNKVDYILGDRIKLPEFSGQWTKRWLKASMDDLIIKLDPDSMAIKSLSSIPDSDVFGHILTLHSRSVVLGGVFGIRGNAAQKILNSGILDDKKFTTNAYAYPRFCKEGIKYGEDLEEDWVSSQDQIMCDVIKQLNLSIAEWNEVLVKDGCYVVNPDDRYAFVHPVYR